MIRTSRPFSWRRLHSLRRRLIKHLFTSKKEETCVPSFSNLLWKLFLARNNPRGHEEQKFLRRRTHVGPPEQVSDDRQASGDWHLSNVGTLRRNDDPANNHGSAIRNRHFCLRRLRVETRGVLHGRYAALYLVC